MKRSSRRQSKPFPRERHLRAINTPARLIPVCQKWPRGFEKLPQPLFEVSRRRCHMKRPFRRGGRGGGGRKINKCPLATHGPGCAAAGTSSVPHPGASLPRGTVFLLDIPRAKDTACEELVCFK